MSVEGPRDVLRLSHLCSHQEDQCAGAMASRAVTSHPWNCLLGSEEQPCAWSWWRLLVPLLTDDPVQVLSSGPLVVSP